MNMTQRIVLLIGALLFVALGLYPPWHHAGSSVEKVEITERAGYDEKSPIAAAAAAAPEEYDYSLRYSLIFKPPQSASRIDLSRLGVEWLCLIVLAGSLIVVLGKRRSNAE